MFRQIADICRAEKVPYRYMPLGIQRHSNTVQLFKTAKALGVDYILAKELQPANYAAVLERVDTFLYQCKTAYITICTDVFSSAFAPGVSATQSFGADPETAVSYTHLDVYKRQGRHDRHDRKNRAVGRTGTEWRIYAGST